LEELSFDKLVHKALLGDSHMGNGINDELLNGTINLAKGGEAYSYSLNKVKFIHHKVVELDTIYLSIGYHNFSDNMDFYIFDHDYVDRYFYSLPWSLQKSLLAEIESPTDFFLRNVIRNFKGLMREGVTLTDMLGGYENRSFRNGVKEDILTKRIESQYYQDGELRGFSEANINYFEDFVDYCKSEGIKLFALKLPVDREYEKRVPEKFKLRLNEVIDRSKVDLIDFKELNLTDDYFIADGDHLSHMGSQLVSKYLAEYPFGQ
ncbi:MAG: hypothetical protein ACI8Q1_003390, partial [Parvicella sp.]